MDCDLQEPPEVIPRLYHEALKGYDVVYARRRSRSHPRFRDHGARLYFRLLNAVAGTDLSAEYGNFSIISRKVVDAFLKLRDADRQYLMILNWLGFSASTIDFDHAERYAGGSTYTFRALVSFAFDGLFFQTAKILRWIVYAGFAISAIGAALAVYLVANYLTTAHPYPGWTSLGVVFLLLSGFIIVSSGVTGLYIAKIFIQVKDRPLYVVDRDVGPPPELERRRDQRARSARGGGRL
jgi:dolichol-phosphate mannosyltransferase